MLNIVLGGLIVVACAVGYTHHTNAKIERNYQLRLQAEKAEQQAALKKEGKAIGDKIIKMSQDMRLLTLGNLRSEFTKQHPNWRSYESTLLNYHRQKFINSLESR